MVSLLSNTLKHTATSFPTFGAFSLCVQDILQLCAHFLIVCARTRAQLSENIDFLGNEHWVNWIMFYLLRRVQMQRYCFTNFHEKEKNS